MNKQVTVNSKEFLLRKSNGHASVAYNSIGKQLARIRLNTTSSEANRPTLSHKVFNALKKHDLALSKLHLKVQPLLKNTIISKAINPFDDPTGDSAVSAMQ